MTTTQPNQTGTWEPDYGELLRAHSRGDDPIHDAVANYREQQRRAGIVEVRWLDLAIDLGVEGAHNTMEYDDAIERLHAVLAAAKEQP